MHDVSVPAFFDCPDQVNAADVVFDLAAEHPAETAFSVASETGWRDISHEQFAREVLDLARGLIAMKVHKGARVAVMCRSRYEWGVIDFAVQAIGAIVVPVYETSSAEQLEWIISDSGAARLFVETPELADRVAAVRDRLPNLTDVWCIEDGAIGAIITQATGITDAQVHERRASTSSDDDATIVYTSGSTGRPKGCRLSHGNLVSNARNAVAYVGSFLVPGASTLLFLPLAHVFARIIQLAAFTARVRIGHQPDISQLVPTLAEFRPNFLLAVPRVFEKVYNSAEQKARAEGKGRIFEAAAATAIAWSEAKSAGRVPPLLAAKHAVFDKLVGAKLRAALGGQCRTCVSGGAPLGTRLGHFFRGVGVEVLEGYGMTETSPVAAVNSESANKIGSVGRPIPGGSIRVAEDGELLVKGPHVFSGYWGNDEATAEVMRGDWLCTGDLGSIDPAGFVFITGRKKEIIVTAGGKNVAPAILEDRLRAHPLVSQCIVVGEQRPFIGALVTIDRDLAPGWLKENSIDPNLTMDEVIRHPVVLTGIQSAVDDANRAVSRAESIRKFTILPIDFSEDAGQLTPSMKIKRNVILEQFAEQIDDLYRS